MLILTLLIKLRLIKELTSLCFICIIYLKLTFTRDILYDLNYMLEVVKIHIRLARAYIWIKFRNEWFLPFKYRKDIINSSPRARVLFIFSWAMRSLRVLHSLIIQFIRLDFVPAWNLYSNYPWAQLHQLLTCQYARLWFQLNPHAYSRALLYVKSKNLKRKRRETCRGDPHVPMAAFLNLASDNDSS